MRWQGHKLVRERIAYMRGISNSLNVSFYARLAYIISGHPYV